jgi:hypothetical protein
MESYRIRLIDSAVIHCGPPPLTRLAPAALGTLSREGRGKP